MAYHINVEPYLLEVPILSLSPSLHSSPPLFTRSPPVSPSPHRYNLLSPTSHRLFYDSTCPVDPPANKSLRVAIHIRTPAWVPWQYAHGRTLLATAPPLPPHALVHQEVHPLSRCPPSECPEQQHSGVSTLNAKLCCNSCGAATAPPSGNNLLLSARLTCHTSSRAS